MADREIIATISRRGDVKLDLEGFVGTSCQDASKALEEAFATTSVEHDPKPEMYEQDQEERQKLSF